ncbi:MAG: hypothetical protein QOE57_2189 [Acidimicrobiaceae bacterium]|nr:hypothetical protein [Acidimicrobiaceae bacterium]
MAAAAAAAVASWSVLLAGPAAAASSTQLSVTASGATTVGLTVFANVNLFGGSHPGGNVTFRLFGPNDPSCRSAIFTSTVAVSGTSINSGRWTTTSAGTHRWEVSYSGDGANSPSGPTPCSQPSAAVIVTAASTSLAVTATAQSGGGPLHATAILGGTQHPTGTVTFLLSPPGDTFCSKTVFTASVAVHGAGSYPSPAFPPTATGTYKWRASYSGDTSNAAGPVTACLDPGAAATVTSVSAPQANPTPATAAHAAATPAPTAPAHTAAPAPATSTTTPPPPAGVIAGPTPPPTAKQGAPTSVPAPTSTSNHQPSNPKLALADSAAHHSGQTPLAPVLAITAAAIVALAGSLLARTVAARRKNRAV